MTPMGPTTTSVSGVTRDRLRTLTELGYVADPRGVIVVQGVELRLTLHGQNQTLRILNPKHQEVPWNVLLPLLRPQPAPLCPAPPPRVKSQPRMSARQASLHALAERFSR